ncbi:hypothetical protein ACF07V_17775 [Streptomyces sp. NPDC015661]|uniref:hypothetical protein n=1 Tax=Streptomyces sp. NPDC015661 TaxID=3364961 RepID=UPI0036FA1ABD
MTAAGYDTRTDTAFFADIAEVFRNHPEAAERYALASLALQRELGVDFARQHGLSRIEDERIITEFRERMPEPTEPAVLRARICVLYRLVGQDLECVDWVDAKE